MAFLLWQLLFCSVAAADARSEAQKHFEVGDALLNGENYMDAALQFQSSVKLYPTQSALFNLANCFRALGKYAEALATIQRLKREFGTALTADIREATARQEKEIREMVAELGIEVNRDGAEVIVNGNRVGRSPLADPLFLSPGEHTVEVRSPGYTEVRRIVNLISGTSTTEGFELLAVSPVESIEPKSPASTEPKEAREEPTELPPPEAGPPDNSQVNLSEDTNGKISPVFFWVGLGTTVAFGAVTLAIYVPLQDKLDRLEDNPENENLRNESKTIQLTGRIFLGLTGAAVITTTVLAIFTDFKSKESRKETVAAVPILTGHGGGLGLQGGF